MMTKQSGVRKILIIDDDNDMTAVLSTVLREAGYEVYRAADGDEGVKTAAAESPDLIILDFLMPVKNGFDACHEIRQLPHMQNVPILALTSYGRDLGESYAPDRKAALASLHDCLEKPVEFNVLLARVGAALSRTET